MDIFKLNDKKIFYLAENDLISSHIFSKPGKMMRDVMTLVSYMKEPENFFFNSMLLLHVWFHDTSV